MSYIAQRLIDNERLTKKVRQLEAQVKAQAESEGEEREEDEYDENEDMEEQTDESAFIEEKPAMAVNSKRKAGSTVQGPAVDAGNKRRRVTEDEDEDEHENDEGDEDVEAEREEESVFIKRRRVADEEDASFDDDGADDGDSDDEFVPPARESASSRKKTQKATQAFNFFGSPGEEGTVCIEAVYCDCTHIHDSSAGRRQTESSSCNTK